MTTKTLNPAETAERDFILARTLPAPRALVYAAWTDPREMAQWWGPKDFTNPVCQWDARPGSAFRIVMRAPDGAEYPFKGVFHEVVKPARIVYTNDMSEHGIQWHERVNQFRPHAHGKNIQNVVTTVTFRDRDNQTRLEIRMDFESAEDRDALVQCGMNEGWSQSLDKLATLLARA